MSFSFASPEGSDDKGENDEKAESREDDMTEETQEPEDPEPARWEFPSDVREEPTPHQEENVPAPSGSEFDIPGEEKREGPSENEEYIFKEEKIEEPTLPEEELPSEEKAKEPSDTIGTSLQEEKAEFSSTLEKPQAQEQIPPDPDHTETPEEEHWTSSEDESAVIKGDPDPQEAPESNLEDHGFVFPDLKRREESVGETPLSVTPYLSLFVILLIIFSMTTVMHQAQPTRLESLIKAIPWYGPLVFKNNYLRKGVSLTSLRSGYQKIQGNREVFVISGEVLNRNPVVVREVQLEGLIYAAGNKEVGRQVISVGNAISSKIIQDMTSREISILQRLKPHTKFSIPPEESSSFAIVFLKPIRNIKSFSCVVLTALGEA